MNYSTFLQIDTYVEYILRFYLWRLDIFEVSLCSAAATAIQVINHLLSSKGVTYFVLGPRAYPMYM